MEQGSRLEIEIGGTTPGTDHDRIEIGGVANLAGGTLDVVLIDSYQPGAGDSFAFLSANGGFDNFAAANLPALDPGLVWQLNPGGITFSLNVATALPGDYNQDGTVNAADYTRWRDTLGEEVTRGSFADGSGDGTVNQADYTVWRLNFGSADQGAVAVPEPQALLTIVLVGITLIAYPVRRA